MKPPPSSFQGVSPVLMSAPVSVSASNSGIPNYDQMTYPFRKAIFIDEIRYSIRTTAEEANLNPINLGALVTTKLQFGRHYLMRDATPIWLLGTYMSSTQEQGAEPALDVAAVYSNYRWKLPEPLYLEAGEVLRSTFFRGADGMSPFVVQVTYVGRTVPPNQPRPAIIPVPYVAPWVTTLGNTYQQSNEFNLFNPFDVPLRIQRLTGRVFRFVLTTTAYAELALTPSTATGGVTLLANDSWGGKMVNNLTGPSDVFDALRGAWTVDTELPPKGMYLFQAWNMPTAQQVHIAMVGSREEAL